MWYPEERSIQVRVQARQARKTKIDGREKRISSFLGKEKESARMGIPSLSHTFCSAGFINPKAVWNKDKEISVDKAFGSLSTNMVEVKDQKASNTRLPSFP